MFYFRQAGLCRLGQLKTNHRLTTLRTTETTPYRDRRKENMSSETLLRLKNAFGGVYCLNGFNCTIHTKTICLLFLASCTIDLNRQNVQ